MTKQRVIRTAYGVEIPCDENGNPLCDAPGKYDRAAALMGAPTEHRPPKRHREDDVICTLHRNGSGQDAGALDYSIDSGKLDQLSEADAYALVLAAWDLLAALGQHVDACTCAVCGSVVRVT